MTPNLDHALFLARTALAFGRVNRITFHEDGITSESDTDHTIMLALIAVDLAPARLDPGDVALYALVHDLVEVYAGDVQTLRISPEARTLKAEREARARDRLLGELGSKSSLAHYLYTYEMQKHPAARFVRLLDKVLPKLTHMSNACAAPKAMGLTPAEFLQSHSDQYATLLFEYPEFPETLQLLHDSMTAAEAAWGDHALD